MVTNLHVISGLPRSGSTLLSAILRQNPLFVAGITSPVAMLCSTLQQKMSAKGEFAVRFDDERRRRLLRSVFDGYYGDATQDHVVFDTNRTWTGRIGFLKKLYSNVRIICCVRDVGWIIDSVERMLDQNPLQLSTIFGFIHGSSVYGRVETLMNTERGLIGQAWSSFREAWFSEHARDLIVIPYDRLVQNPKIVIDGLYAALGERPYPHRFDDIAYDEAEFDIQIGMPGLHKVHRKVEPFKRVPGIPPDLFAKYADANFWLRPEMNTRGVHIL